MSEQEDLFEDVLERTDLRIELKYRHLNGKKFRAKKLYDYLVQSTPFDAYLVVTNISGKAFRGARVKEAKFSFNGHNMSHTVTNEVQLPSLNPKQSATVSLDSATFNVDGSCWFSCQIIPDDVQQEVFTYQYDKQHDKDISYRLNQWGAPIYVEGKLASLQTRTNNYILILTIITVLEAIFGIKDMLVMGARLLAYLFSLLSELFGYLSTFT
ncbi:hypothetical protein OKZ60_001605 [Vibrio alginolyticus]|nr:hypothetical protein [Vibrio alginolyticus]